ncbi:MAG: GerMN domain-containing protein [Armatimonadetes bacterium]|nr:hypothetical protein [Armatimonadota bacterium]MBS1703619.1 GerMN domain-containing protein [Armatimonadota bacterium]MBS1728371.1 GerMN domain-containing protein [Armatimonadota bacterium]
MKNRSFPWALIAVAAVAGAGFAGVISYVRNEPKNSFVTNQPIDQPGEVISKPQTTSGGTTSGTPAGQKTTHLSRAEDVNAALKAKNYGEFRVLAVNVENGNAIVDMNDKLLEGMGSEAEADFIETMKAALAKFDDVKTFQIRIDGEIQKSLSHFEMLDPVPVR